MRLLGKMSDTDLTAQFGRPVGAVRFKRTRLKIPKADDRRAPFLSGADLALLGTMADEDLAARLGRTVGAVRQQRTESDIPAIQDRRRRSTE